MARLLVLVEGETEETFVNELVAPHLLGLGFHAVDARMMGNARMRSKRGGIQAWPRVLRELSILLREDRARHITTLVDYYGLPATGSRAWPGRSEAATLPFAERAACIEEQMQRAVDADNPHLDCSRLHPYVVMHEFEGLLFSDGARFARAIDCPEVTAEFLAIAAGFPTPEHINDGPDTHPSARVQELVPKYQKPLFGNLAALDIGLSAIAEECPGFRAWLGRLEAIRV